MGASGASGASDANSDKIEVKDVTGALAPAAAAFCRLHKVWSSTILGDTFAVKPTACTKYKALLSDLKSLVQKEPLFKVVIFRLVRPR